MVRKLIRKFGKGFVITKIIEKRKKRFTMEDI